MIHSLPAPSPTCRQRALRGWLAGLFCLLCQLCLPGSAWSAAADDADEPQDLIVHRAFWEDPSGQASFEYARGQAYQPYQGILSRGYSDSAHWLRLTIPASTEALGLRITPAWLDSITLHDPADPAAPITVGDRHPLQREALPGLGHSFLLPPAAAPRDIWLRLQSTSSHYLNAQLLPLSQIAPAGARQMLRGTFYVTALVLILCVLLTIWWIQRDRILGAYLLRHSVYTYYGAAYLGLPTLLFSEWLPPAFFDQAFSLSATIIVPLSIRFDLAFLSAYQPRPLLMTLLKGLGLLGVGVVLTLLAGHTRLALQLNAYLLITATVVLALTAFSAKSEPQVEKIMPRRVMVTYYALIFSSLLVGLVNVLGWVALNEWAIYALIVHGLVSGLMMATMLVVRAQRLASLNQQMSWKLQKAEQDMEEEQRRRHEQSQFLHMLMHELKTPLTVVSLALGTRNHREKNLEHAGRAVKDMKSIIDRCIQADQLGEHHLPRQTEPVALAALVRERSADIPTLAQRLQIAAAPDLPPLHTDRQLLQVILTNLLGNAARYSDPFTPVVIVIDPATQQGKAGLALRIGNTPGLAGWPDEQRLFSKYYRASGAQRESGSGLGLYLARQLAESLGGSLTYAPSNQHVEFILWIPLTPA